MSQISSVTEKNSSPISQCRLCGFGTFFDEKLILKPTALANELCPGASESYDAEEFPLTLVMCINCKHIQLNVAVTSQRLFDSYIYTSSTSVSFRDHFQELAEKMTKYVPSAGSILEVGSNDGFLLSALQENGFQCLGLEPSQILVEQSRNLGVEVHQGYLDERSVLEIGKSHGEFDCVVGNNVFAHIPDLAHAIGHVKGLLKEGGVFVVEVAHAVEILRKGIFDTIYHEHHSYHTLLALRPFLESLGFGLVDVEEIDTHGGSIRIIARKGTQSISGNIEKIEGMERDLGFDRPKVFEAIKEMVEKIRSGFDEAVIERGSSIIFGYAAPAKVVTFLYQVCENPKLIEFIVDDNAMKQGKFLPGLGIPVVGSEYLQAEIRNNAGRTWVCFVFAWNLSKELKDKIKLLLPAGSEIVTFFPTMTKEILS